jgi:hypothetical protein
MLNAADLLAASVVYTVHEGHTAMQDVTEIAGIIGDVNADGTADLVLFAPNREPRWIENVPMGTGPHSFRLAHSPVPVEPPPVALPTNDQVAQAVAAYMAANPPAVTVVAASAAEPAVA